MIYHAVFGRDIALLASTSAIIFRWCSCLYF